MDYIIVQAGGKGSRLEYLTKNKPKALVPVENLPMIFHLFRKYPDKRFIVIADYKKEVMRRYLAAFAGVKYLIVEAEGTGTCSGVRQALELVPEGEAFMLVWSDLILPEAFSLPPEYEDPEKNGVPEKDYVGLSGTFPCRWKYENRSFSEERSVEYGVAGFFLFAEKQRLPEVPVSGELVKWMGEAGLSFEEISLAGTREFGLLEEYEKLEEEKCRPFNRITIKGERLIKEPVDDQGRSLAEREAAWYRKAQELIGSGGGALPEIYGFSPLEMERIRGKNIYECELSDESRRGILKKLVEALKKLHEADSIPSDPFSLKEAYFTKTMKRLSLVEELVPFARDPFVTVNGRKCRNVFFHREELEKKLEGLSSERFSFIHGDCTFSNLMLREDESPVFIDPRGYFGFTRLYGDVRYDWAKLYYSVVGNYDQFNLKRFRLEIDENEVKLKIRSNGWEALEPDFFELTGTDPEEIKLLHAVIWLSLTTYAWQDYDSICGAFYNGLYYLEEVL
ncbi:MAG: NTP transferase domain-containing protein [Lachnospiraceae bacterium]|nr:NTP transferase domain-containing protein [Lachnospiraceae bacterium]